MTMAAKAELGVKRELSRLEIEREEREAQLRRSGFGALRWYIWQRLRGTDAHAITVFERWSVEVYYPRIVELKPVPRRQMSRSQRNSGIVIQKPREVALFPGYILTRLNLSNRDWRDAIEMAGVGGLVCRDGMPVYLPDETIAAIRRRENHGVIAGSDSAKVVFDVGDAVVVTNGPFSGFPGTVEEGLDVPIADLEPGMRIKVAVNIFGRATPVDLEQWQVAKGDIK